MRLFCLKQRRKGFAAPFPRTIAGGLNGCHRRISSHLHSWKKNSHRGSVPASDRLLHSAMGIKGNHADVFCRSIFPRPRLSSDGSWWAASHRCMDWRRFYCEPRLRDFLHVARRSSTKAQTDSSLCSGSINYVPMLGHHNLSRRNQSPRRSPRRLHQTLPVPATLQPTHRLRRLRRTDRLISAPLRQQTKDRSLKFSVRLSRLMPPTGVAAVLDHVPILFPLLSPLKVAPARLADLVLVRSRAFGFPFTVRHRRKMQRTAKSSTAQRKSLKKSYKSWRIFRPSKSDC